MKPQTADGKGFFGSKLHIVHNHELWASLGIETNVVTNRTEWTMSRICL